MKPVAGGYELTLRLDAPAPMRASFPLLAVDGVPMGVAKQSPDRRTLTGGSDSLLLDRSFGHGLVLDDDPTPTLTVGNAQSAEGADRQATSICWMGGC